MTMFFGDLLPVLGYRDPPHQFRLLKTLDERFWFMLTARDPRTKEAPAGGPGLQSLEPKNVT